MGHEKDLDLARTISRIAAAHGLTPAPARCSRSSRARHRRPRPARPVLVRRADRRPRPPHRRHRPRPGRPGASVWFQGTDEHAEPRQRWHLDVWVAPETADARIAAALAAGGVVVDDSEAPSFIVLADPDGNKACICTALDGAERRTRPPPGPGLSRLSGAGPQTEAMSFFADHRTSRWAVPPPPSSSSPVAPSWCRVRPAPTPVSRPAAPPSCSPTCAGRSARACRAPSCRPRTSACPQIPGLSGQGSGSPAASAGGASLTSVISGTHTWRVWAGGPTQAGSPSSAGPVSPTSSATAPTYGSGRAPRSRRCTTPSPRRTPPPAPRPARPPTCPRRPRRPRPRPSPPSTPRTAVTTAGTAVVAGRQAYELVLDPRTDATRWLRCASPSTPRSTCPCGCRSTRPSCPTRRSRSASPPSTSPRPTPVSSPSPRPPARRSPRAARQGRQPPRRPPRGPGRAQGRRHRLDLGRRRDAAGAVRHRRDPEAAAGPALGHPEGLGRLGLRPGHRRHSRLRGAHRRRPGRCRCRRPRGAVRRAEVLVSRAVHRGAGVDAPRAAPPPATGTGARGRRSRPSA